MCSEPVNGTQRGSGYRNRQLEWLRLVIALTGRRCCVLSFPPLGSSPIALLLYLTHFIVTFFFFFPLPFCRMLLRSKNSKSTAPLTHISMPRCVLCCQHFTASLLQAALACFQVQCQPVAIRPVGFAAAWGTRKMQPFIYCGLLSSKQL